MITEDYVSYRVARLLKEKGFDELCYACYEYFKSNMTMYSGWPFEYKGEPVHNTNDGVKCPTHQMAMKWLREVHKILIVVGIKKGDRGEYRYSIKSIRNDVLIGISDRSYIHYEEATDAALEYCLANLI